MKHPLKHLILFSMNTIIWLCFVMWVFGVADHACSAADEPEQTEERALVKMEISIPLVAPGYDAIYQRFLNGVLIYRPKGDGNDAGRINLPIRDLGNPLEGTFDLSRCGNTGKYLSISTGYRKGKKPENASKVEVWIAPRFLIERELNTTAAHFGPIMGDWKKDASVGIFWTWGGWAAHDHDMEELVTESMDNLSKVNLYENWEKRRYHIESVTDYTTSRMTSRFKHFLFRF